MSGMHGRKKIRTTEELQQARKEREAVKIKEYNALVAECFEKLMKTTKEIWEYRHGSGNYGGTTFGHPFLIRFQIAIPQKTEKQYDGAALNITTRILHQNPDFYTVWNFRRLILREGVLKDARISYVRSADAIQVSLKSELDFFMQIITINPKSYWMWNHRRWCLETIPKPAWERELALVDKMLDMDARNFHGWNYRRYVISQLARDPGMTDTQALRTSPALARSEFEFTTRKVTQNFSNYSAWHNRSKLLPIVVDEIEGEEARNEIARQGGLGGTVTVWER
ncbi:hypothetical protein BC936DRAFT_145327 [Jimgerdemannia flammicorona]|uniref:Geranylgeranyl transferase type-2 subunit alpha n=1 Tax=Jimgerdemannia flammicorona TaxID=994334 RepID=A0A433DAA9_9FUNG|nr:hypothetical protein BC936DRAFT_145327 [Jimgerdemannia flammicorona]